MTRKQVDTIGSPVYHIDIGDIADGSFELHDLDDGVYRKYSPFDFIEIYNKNAVDYELVLNDVNSFPIPASAVITKSDILFRNFRINNNSGAALTGSKLYVTVQHTPLTADKASRKPESLFRKILPFVGFLR